jgi:glucose-6-phosphate isomerase, archaeal
MSPIERMLATFDPSTGTIDGIEPTRRHLSDLRDAFADRGAVDRMMRDDNPLVYTVSSVEAGSGEGALHYGVGCIMPGTVNGEYFLTKGHIHAWRPAAELYIGFRGHGKMIMQASSAAVVVDLLPHSAVYVPGATAHRTVNTGNEPLVYIGVYPALAGHDYSSPADNFSKVIIERNGDAVVLDRAAFLATISQRTEQRS